MSDEEKRVGVDETLIDALGQAAEDTSQQNNDGESVPVTVRATSQVEVHEQPVSLGVAPPTVTPVPVAQPVPTAVATQQPGAISAGTFVLQWLSYAFWVWFGISLGWLTGVVVTYLITGDHSSETGISLAYPLAAVIVMLGIALITDFFYSRRELAHKTGGSMIIMMLHAVPMVLAAISALITAVFAVILMILSTDPLNGVDTPKITMLISIVMAITYGLMAFRLVFGGKRRVIRIVFWAVMTVLALAAIITGFVGPAADAARTKQDRLVESALPSLTDDIRSYALKNDALPAQLSDVTHTTSSSSKAVQQIIDQHLVTYKPNTVPSSDGNSYTPASDTIKSTIYPPTSSTKRFYYQLCTRYIAEKKSDYNYTQDSQYYLTGESALTTSGVAADYRIDNLYSINSHPAGTVCYDLYADGKYTYAPYETTVN